jgi:hypothetical protein
MMFFLLIVALGCGTQSSDVGPKSTMNTHHRVASAEQLVGPWSNRLEKAQSPYLRMHGQDPVNWYSWGDEAFAAAKNRNVPIFLSIGYYACHWCHVMHRESFKDPAIAAFLNQHFVAIKVDREERPDIDSLYMDAVHILNRNNGGWPASIWLTPDGKPFFAGTYFPPQGRQGRPGFMELLERIQQDWVSKPEEIHGFAAKTGKRILARAELQGAGAVPKGAAADAAQRLLGSWSTENRGWGTRRQFPMTSSLQFMLWHSVLADNQAAGSLVAGQLAAMDEGGIHDHLGGGFHRYTVDRQWVVPHFEKMLYDNGQLLASYTEAAIALNRPRFGQVAEDIGDYLIRQMQDKDGGFYSSQSADSEGEEGTFYVWKPAEVEKVLGDASTFLAAFPFTEKGNFEGSRTVLNRRPEVDPETADIKIAREKLFQYRSTRESPPTDKKLVVAWNGLAIGGLARAGRLLDRPRFIVAAQRAAKHALSVVVNGKVPRLIADQSPLGVLEDYAFLGNGLLDLFEADGDPQWLKAADAIAVTMLERFRDPQSGVLYQADKDVALLARKTDLTDGAEPSGYGRALRLLSRLRSLGSPTAQPSVIDAALQQSAWLLERAPNNAVSVVSVADRLARRSTEVIIATPSMEHPSLEGLRDAYDDAVRPHTVLAIVTPETADQLSAFSAILGKEPGPEGARAFVCYDGVCHLPTTDVDVFKKQLAQ